ncbi:MAG TPA: sodium:solute symporter family protein [Verrucomicrobiae bacterium]|jgi:SSS family solute:Na+ symporter|nr:sodium:solute symporter family protein [Verrucomicrobiae bacterium]
MRIHLAATDYAILFVYFCLVIVIGWMAKRNLSPGEGFLFTRSLPAWITGLAFLSTNLGAQEVIGSAASGAKYGIMASHFYWIGAIPAMVFLSIFMMPFYYGSKVRSVPEYLKLRFDKKTHAFNAVTFAATAIVISGISLHTVALLISTLAGWSYGSCIAISCFVLFVYIFLGGLTSVIYNEVLQFFMLVIGLTPLSIMALRGAGGWNSLKQKLAVTATDHHFPAGAWTHAWQFTGDPAQNPMGIGWFGMVAGLGFVLSFGYWCTNFTVVQRAMSARSMSAAQVTPLIAALPKMLFPALIVLPGIAAMALNTSTGGSFLPAAPDGTPDYNLAIPALMQRYFPTGLLGIGFTALVASFMSGMAGNISAFNTVWTFDIYQSYLVRNKSDTHYLWIGRFATIAGMLLSISVAYVASSKFNNIMDMLQLVASFVNAPLLATFLLGMFWRRSTGHGAFLGLLCGTVSAAALQGTSLVRGDSPGIKGGWLGVHFLFSSEMAQNFWIGIVAFSMCLALTILISLYTRQLKSHSELAGLVYSLTPGPGTGASKSVISPLTLGLIILISTIILNVIFW